MNSGKRKRMPATAPAAPPQDNIELLIERAINSQTTSSVTSLHTLLYNTTPSMQTLAYKHGLSVGRLIAQKYGSFERLLYLLEVGGLGQVLYTPSTDVSHIRSTRRITELDLGTPAHHYEAGLISGYFSAYTNSQITTRETHCAFDGADSCVFTSSGSVPALRTSQPAAQKIVDCITTTILAQPRIRETEDTYTLLALQPLLEGAIVKSLAQLMQGSGERLADTIPNAASATIGKIGSFIGARAQLSKSTKAKKSITVTYTLCNSTMQYLELTLPVFVGFLSREYAQEHMDVRRNAKGAYLVRIDFIHR